MPPRRTDPRRELERHVLDVQRTIRSCSGCGLCCTQSFNAVQILPPEGERIARHLASLPAERRAELEERVARTIRRHHLRDDAAPRRYTCAFLEADFRCALPLDVKPVACLAFNPITPDSCDQEPERYHAAHAEVEREDASRRRRGGLRAIPIAVRNALPRRSRS
jgi:Fe-S-cluster containining protein